jgi:uncharacterized membrane protein (DUF441 family)
MNDILTSFVRTIVPYVIGATVAWLGNKGLHVSDSQVASATALLTFGVGSAYYLVARWLEGKNPKLGVLLGIPTKPTYNQTN